MRGKPLSEPFSTHKKAPLGVNQGALFANP